MRLVRIFQEYRLDLSLAIRYYLVMSIGPEELASYTKDSDLPDQPSRMVWGFIGPKDRERLAQGMDSRGYIIDDALLCFESDTKFQIRYQLLWSAFRRLRGQRPPINRLIPFKEESAIDFLNKFDEPLDPVSIYRAASSHKYIGSDNTMLRVSSKNIILLRHAQSDRLSFEVSVRHMVALTNRLLEVVGFNEIPPYDPNQGFPLKVGS